MSLRLYNTGSERPFSGMVGEITCIIPGKYPYGPTELMIFFIRTISERRVHPSSDNQRRNNGGDRR
jgi:hypothetical protein